MRPQNRERFTLHLELLTSMNTHLPSPSPKPLDIAIAGETNLDLILYGLLLEMPTERELLGSGFNITLGGSSSILAHNLSVLGAGGTEVYRDAALHNAFLNQHPIA
jgi:hypothetical protein